MPRPWGKFYGVEVDVRVGDGVLVGLGVRVGVDVRVDVGARVGVDVRVGCGVREGMAVGLGGLPRVGVVDGVSVAVGSGPMAVRRAEMVGAAAALAPVSALAARRSATSSLVRPAA
jgi:hypothetical protein